MNSIKLIRISIVIQWVLIIISIVIGFIEEIYFASILKECRLVIVDGGSSTVMNIGMILGIVAIIGYAIASVGVFKLKIWSRLLYLWSNILGLLMIPFLGITVMAPFSYMIDEAATVFIGITIAFLYFSEAKEHFKKTSNNLPQGMA